MEYVDLSAVKFPPGSRRQIVRLFISTEKLNQEKREGNPMAHGLGLTARVAAVALMSVLSAQCSVHADDTTTASKAGIDAKTAFAKIKTLAGDWKVQTSDEPKIDHGKAKREDHTGGLSVNYKVTGAGSALMETQFPGSDHEMVSVYHLDGDDLRMTHYCAAGNQPRVKLDRALSTPEQLLFVFDGGTNLNPQKDMHIHGVKITFHEDGKVTSAWDGYVGGKKAGTTSFLMSRQKSAHTAQPSPASSH
jgi:hypothetical protein